jgi:hypothetical protein
MIANDDEMRATQERIAEFERLLAELRVRARPEEFPLVAGGYRREIERMTEDLLEYLTRHASEPLPVESR